MLSIAQQDELNVLGDYYLNEALAKGQPFSEALCDAAIAKAKRELNLC